jgi:hypothetical protein
MHNGRMRVHPNYDHTAQEQNGLLELMCVFPGLLAEIIGEVYRHHGCNFWESWECLSKSNNDSINDKEPMLTML